MKCCWKLGACLLLLWGCAGRGAPNENEARPPAAVPAEQHPAAGPSEEEMQELEGRLQPTVEAGGWVLETEQGTYLLLSIGEYREESWFQEGARVKVKGKESPDTITIFMQGTPFQVEEMEPVENPE